MSVILMTTLFYKALLLQGEIWFWSLLGLKGLKHINDSGVSAQFSFVCSCWPRFAALKRQFSSTQGLMHRNQISANNGGHIKSDKMW